MPASALLIHGVPVGCINQAAVHYLVPARVIVSVLVTEGAAPGIEKHNKNGTSDLGALQINSRWLKVLQPYGITRDQLKYDPCVNVMVGAWILGKKMAGAAGQGDYWHGVAAYNSITPGINAAYKTKVRRNYRILSAALDGRIFT